MIHVPVLKKEVLKYLDPKPNQNFVDCTFGEGGHSFSILKKIKPKGKVLGIEADPVLYRRVESNLRARDRRASYSSRLILVNSSYTALKQIVEKLDFSPVNGVLFDVGMSSWHLEESGRGFSFQKDEPLDMRYNPQTGLTARKIINNWKQGKIHKMLRDYGNERFATKIARRIVNHRKKESIKTTSQLIEVIKKAIPSKHQHGKIHFATRTFQALRIVVNNELENFEKTLLQSLKILEPKGRIVTISFHSLEDRIAKRFFKERSNRNQLKILTKKPITAGNDEVEKNPRSRSAKLRAAEKK